MKQDPEVPLGVLTSCVALRFITCAKTHRNMKQVPIHSHTECSLSFLITGGGIPDPRTAANTAPLNCSSVRFESHCRTGTGRWIGEMCVRGYLVYSSDFLLPRTFIDVANTNSYMSNAAGGPFNELLISACYAAVLNFWLFINCCVTT